MAEETERQMAAAAPPGVVADEDVEAERSAASAARQALLDQLKKFSSKRWDTNLAVRTLQRLVDRRKEIIGQLWESVEKEDEDQLRRVVKFSETFHNIMDARRRLDAVVRLVGRSHMDPRKAKWFTDQILRLSKLAGSYAEALRRS